MSKAPEDGRYVERQVLLTTPDVDVDDEGRLSYTTETEQMAFEDVVELEEQVGDPEYTAWLAAGRPVLSWDEWDALRTRRARRAPVEDVLPGL